MKFKSKKEESKYKAACKRYFRNQKKCYIIFMREVSSIGKSLHKGK